jgi:FOG: WD40-like repeat
MKAIAFTLDALLALVIAAAAISVLLYFQFYPETAYVIKSAEAQSTLSLLFSTNVSSLANSTGIISAIIGQQGSADQAWTQYQGRASRTGSQPSGPLTSFVSNTITVNAPITMGIAADYGNIYFASGNTLYAFNATGYQAWSVDTGANVETLPVLVDGKVIYWNSQGMSAVSAFNGSAIWTDSAFAAATPSAPMIAYDGELIAFADGNVYSVYQNNGTVWSATALGTSNTVVTAAIGGGGSLALGTAADTILLLTNINNVGSQGVIWSTSTGTATPAGLLSYGNVLAAFGGQYAVEQDINSTSIGFISTGATVSGDAVSGTGTVVYQVSNEVMALATNGITLWTKQIPAAPYGSALAGSSPVIGGGSVYSLWSNNYLIAENTSTGSIKWSTRLPYSGSLAQHDACIRQALCNCRQLDNGIRVMRREPTPDGAAGGGDAVHERGRQLRRLHAEQPEAAEQLQRDVRECLPSGHEPCALRRHGQLCRNRRRLSCTGHAYAELLG